MRRVEGGWCELRLTGLAADLAAEAGITDPGGQPDPRTDDGRGVCRRNEDGRCAGMEPDAVP